jgi:hypothetical protein
MTLPPVLSACRDRTCSAGSFDSQLIAETAQIYDGGQAEGVCGHRCNRGFMQRCGLRSFQNRVNAPWGETTYRHVAPDSRKVASPLIRSCCQRFANEIRKPNENKRDQSSSDSSGFTGFFRFRWSLITVWLEVRVLPGNIPPFVETCDHGPPLAGFFALSLRSLCSCQH